MKTHLLRSTALALLLGLTTASASTPASAGLFDVVTKPISKAVKTVEKKVVKPVVKEVSKATKTVEKKVIKPVVKEVGKVTKTVGKKVIKPVVKEVGKATKTVEKKIIKPIGKQIGSTTRTVDRKIIKPIGKEVKTVTTQPIGRTLKTLGRTGEKTLRTVGNGVSKAYTAAGDVAERVPVLREAAPLARDFAKQVKKRKSQIAGAAGAGVAIMSGGASHALYTAGGWAYTVGKGDEVRKAVKRGNLKQVRNTGSEVSRTMKAYGKN